MNERKHRVSGIYAIKHVASGKLYVGSSIHIPRRWYIHRHDLNKRDRHHSILLRRAWEKYGPDAFLWEILELVTNPDDLVIREQYWMDTLRSNDPKFGYNILPNAGTTLGRRMPPKSVEQMRARLTGRKIGPFTEEHRAKLRDAASNRSKESYKLSPERRIKHIAVLKSPKAVAAFQDRMAQRKGKPLSPDHAAKVRAAVIARNKAAIGTRLSAERRQQIRINYYLSKGQPELPLYDFCN